MGSSALGLCMGGHSDCRLCGDLESSLGSVVNVNLDELRALATIQDGPHLRFQPPYRQMSVTLEEADLLYALVRALKPRNVLELGTGLGLSAFFIASALKENGDEGYLMTAEPDSAFAVEALLLLVNLPATVRRPPWERAGWPDLVYIDSAASLRPADIHTWLTNGYEGLVLVHDAEREYPSTTDHGSGVYLPTANGMWLGRAK